MPFQNLKHNYGASGDNHISLYVIGLPPEITPRALGNLFTKCGTVTRVNLLPMNSKFTTKSGFVYYATPKEAKAAVSEFNAFKLGSYCLKVSFSHSNKNKDTENGNYQELLKKLEQGPLTDADASLLLNKDQNKFSNNSFLKKPFHSSRNSCNDSFPKFSHDKKESFSNKSSPARSSFSNSYSRSNNRQYSLSNSYNAKSNHLDQKGFNNNEANSGCQPRQLSVAYFPPSITVGAGFDVLVTDIDTENAVLVCQLADKNLNFSLTKLQESLNSSFSKNCTPINSPSIGATCATIFNKNGKWYRAVIENILDNREAKVRFLDYGNCQVTPLHSLMQLDSEELCVLPAICLMCKMSNTQQSSWTDKHLKVLIQLLQKSKMALHAKCNKIVDNFLYVSFFAGETSVNEALSSIHISPENSISVPTSNDLEKLNSDMLLTNRDSSLQEEQVVYVDKLSETSVNSVEVSTMASIRIPNKRFELLISFAKNPSRFFCQVVGNNLLQLHDSLQLITESINSKPKISNYFPSPGSVCAAVFSDDQLWYRAEVLEILPEDKFHIKYIDYGNSAVVTKAQVQPLPSKFQSLPIQSFEACLHDCYPRNGEELWCEEAIDYFKSFVMKPLSATISPTNQLLAIHQLTIDFDENDTLNNHFVSKGFAETRNSQGNEITANKTSSAQPKDAVSSDRPQETPASPTKSYEIHNDTSANKSIEEYQVSAAIECNGRQNASSSFDEHKKILLLASSTEPQKIHVETLPFKAKKVLNATSLPDQKEDKIINRVSSPEKVSSLVKTSELKSNSFPLKKSYIKPFTPALNEKLQITISCSDESGVFHCQVINKHLETLCENVSELTLHAIKAPLPFPSKLAKGTFCAAYSDVEETWNRAIVLGVKNNSVNVKFIDYGNTKSVARTEVMSLPPEFQSLPSLSLSCVLANLKPLSGEWDERYFQRIDDCIHRKLKAVFLGKDESDNYLIQIPFLINTLIKDEIAEFVV